VVASATATRISSRVPNRRPSNASDLGTSHHRPIRFGYAGYTGRNTNSQRGRAKLKSNTSVARWGARVVDDRVDPPHVRRDPTRDVAGESARSAADRLA
jgi:hypothetical protein